ncbi:DUF5988 family protein [Micromonospora sp. CA-259024]|uniref:DUF5988 family protein n=1 Tax=Micromonospora sp. CA-259024 TaxID=3239965 RepID=UPI003D8C22AD
MTTIPEGDLDKTVTVILVGGPTELPEAARVQRMSLDQYKVKVPHRGGYEHFELPDAEPDATAPLRLYWTTRTRVAE